MPNPKKLTDLQRNWNIAKQYVKESPSLPNILKALKHLLDGPSKYQTGQPEILPGFQLKGLMRGSQLEQQLSKAGTISTNAVKALANKSSEMQGKILNKVLDNQFPAQRVVNYDKFRKAIQSELIPYQTKPQTKYADYGVDRLGYSPRMSPDNMVFNPTTGQFESKAVQLGTFTFESPRIPMGSAKHYQRGTLGHTRTFTNPEEPDVLNVLETQSDWAQHAWSKGTYNKMSKASGHRLEQLRKIIAQQKEKGIPTQATEERIPIQTQYKEVPSWHIQYLQQNYLPRQLQENMLYASRNGYSRMRYPTRDTAIKVEGYEPTLLFGDINKEQQAIKLQERIGQLEFQMAQGTNAFTYRRLSSELQKAKKEYEILKQQSTGQVYSPQDETILKKYDQFPKMFSKVFKDQKPQIVKDSKGNSWFEFAIPQNMQQMELTYKEGGVL